MKVLFDGDIIAFRCSAAGEKEDFGIVAYYMDQLIGDVMQACKGDTFEMFISGKGNFRYDIYPEYKANRDGSFVPRWREQAKQHLIAKYNADVSEGCEADDRMGIAQMAAKGYDEDHGSGVQTHATVIASLDKDLLMIPGNHYSWEISGKSKDTAWTKPAIWQTVDHLEGLRWFYTQCITGDVADNIKGISGRGKVFAKDLLEGLSTEQEMFDAVREEYGIDDEFLMNGRLLWIWQQENDDWIKRFEFLKGVNDPVV